MEDTGRGDGIRDMLVFPDQPQSAGHVVLNRGKRSISVDLKSAEGQAVILKLIGQADVLVDSFRPGVLDRLGLGSGSPSHDESEACTRLHHRLWFDRRLPKSTGP